VLAVRPAPSKGGASSWPTRTPRSSSSSSRRFERTLTPCDGRSAIKLAYTLDNAVHLVISNTRVDGLPGVQLIYQLRSWKPSLPILYIANIDRSTPAIEAKLPRDVPILREPFTAEQLRALVASLLSGEPHALDIGR
jgi:DNA-binding NtrC family response regulator